MPSMRSRQVQHRLCGNQQLDLSGLRVGILSASELLDIVSCLLLGLGAKAVGDDV